MFVIGSTRENLSRLLDVESIMGIAGDPLREHVVVGNLDLVEQQKSVIHGAIDRC